MIENPILLFMKQTISILITVISITCLSVSSQNYLPRNNYGAILEPNNRILNGAGQSNDAFSNYYNLMPDTLKPCIFMTYMGLRDVTANWPSSLIEELDQYSDKTIFIQLGLSMTTDGTPEAHYEQDVADGQYDKQIDNLVNGIINLGYPMFIRIGYEFNGLSWNGYLPESYKQAFIRITNKIREYDIEVATVWNFSADGVSNYINYYPGDEYVDWWSTSNFGTNSFTDQVTLQFIEDADKAGKPVMIGESTPRHIGVTDGESDWNAWFEPYFKFMNDHPGIKAFCYINWNWSEYSQWSDWGDARLETNTNVANNFKRELSDTIFLHGSDEKTFRKNYGYNDNDKPQFTTGIKVLSANYPVQFTWPQAVDVSGISRYVIETDDTRRFLFDTLFTDFNIFAGESKKYTIAAMDKAGNLSNSVEVSISAFDVINKIMNYRFNNDLDNWDLRLFNGGNASASIESGQPLSGNKSGKISITTTTSTDWHIQLSQQVYVKSGKKYKIFYKAKADNTSGVNVYLQQDQSPYHATFRQNQSIGNETDIYIYPLFSASQSYVANFTFMVGQNPNGHVLYFDQALLLETTLDISNIYIEDDGENNSIVCESEDTLLILYLPEGTLDSAYIYYSFKEMSYRSKKLDGTKESFNHIIGDFDIKDTLKYYFITYINEVPIQSDEYVYYSGLSNNPVTIDKIIVDNEHFIYPNPAQDIVKIKGDGIISIYDLSGNKIRTDSAVSKNKKIDIGMLPAGIYIVELINGKVKKRSKIIIQ